MLIGGHFYKHTGYGVENSWLCEPDPAQYLIDWPVISHLMRKSRDEGYPWENSFGFLFEQILGFSISDHFIFEVSWIWDSEPGSEFTIKSSQTPMILYIPDGIWKNARHIYEIPRAPGCWDLLSYVSERWCRDKIHEAIQKIRDAADEKQKFLLYTDEVLQLI